MVVTGINYFLLDSGNVVDPLTITTPDLSTITVLSIRGTSYSIYTDTVVSHEKLFSISLIGEVLLDEAAEALVVAKEEWVRDMGKMISY